MSEAKQAYCMKCKTKRDMVEPQATFTSKGVPMTKGKCSVCGTTVMVMGTTPAHEGLEKPVVEAKPKAEKAPKKAAVTPAKGDKPAKKTASKDASAKNAKKKRSIQNFG